MRQEWKKFLRPRRAAAPQEPPAHVEKLTDQSLWWKSLYRVEMMRQLERDDVDHLGWLDKTEAQVLMTFAELIPGNGVVVEIGSFLGKSSRWLLLGCFLSNNHLTCIDPWNGIDEDTSGAWNKILMGDSFSAFRANLHRWFPFARQVEPHLACRRGRAQKIVKKWFTPIDLLYIDGDHERATLDFEEWEKHLKPHAMVLFDDVTGTGKYGALGPDAAVQIVMARGGWNVTRIGRLACLTRDPEWWRVRQEAYQDQHESLRKWTENVDPGDIRRPNDLRRYPGTDGGSHQPDRQG